MKITKLTAANFRTFNSVAIDLRDDLSLIIGKNNSGKTSLLVLFERFYQDSNNFTYNDFPLASRKKLIGLDKDTETVDLSIRMTIEIKYSALDDLRYLADFILDLDVAQDTVKILFECAIDKKRLLADLPNVEASKESFLRKNLGGYLNKSVYAFLKDEDLLEKNRNKLIKKDLNAVKEIINFQMIHAKRDVASSEGGKNVLSKLTTQYFNRAGRDSSEFDPINKLLLDMDESLEKTYKVFFEPFLKTSKSFLGIENIKVISNLESKEILEDSSQVVYSDGVAYLPETFNGLGHMNILYLLLTIEMKKESFAKNGKSINLLFIEEPEAHTHPQMQYIFSNKIKSILKDIENLQTVITTHSCHIVSQCDFDDIRYLRNSNGVTEIKNFHAELKIKYGSDEESFKFLEQFLTLDSCELFFANKVIFIEGLTERMLLPYFIDNFDKSKKDEIGFVPLSSQNITILEVGANAKVFRHFLELLDIKTLIITDIDTTQVSVKQDGKTVYKACEVAQGTHLSNETIKYYLNAPNISDPKFTSWLSDLKLRKCQSSFANIMLSYQTAEEGYQGRSFEDAFVHINRKKLLEKLEFLKGLKNIECFDTLDNAYELIEQVLAKKSDFASSLLYLALTKDDVEWKTPAYIEEGLQWISK